MSDQDRGSPYIIKQTSEENKEKYQLKDYVDPIPNSSN